jgi:hypothetical protein
MNFREKAASFVLCNDDITEALELLDNASSVSDTIPDEVIVWEKFEYDPIENIIEYIDTIETMLKEAYEEGKRNKLIKMKKAIIVEYSFMTRIVIDEDKENLESIVAETKQEILDKVNTELSENLCEWYDDEEMPYDSENELSH